MLFRVARIPHASPLGLYYGCSGDWGHHLLLSAPSPICSLLGLYLDLSWILSGQYSPSTQAAPLPSPFAGHWEGDAEASGAVWPRDQGLGDFLREGMYYFVMGSTRTMGEPILISSLIPPGTRRTKLFDRKLDKKVNAWGGRNPPAWSPEHGSSTQTAPQNPTSLLQGSIGKDGQHHQLLVGPGTLFVSKISW